MMHEDLSSLSGPMRHEEQANYVYFFLSFSSKTKIVVACFKTAGKINHSRQNRVLLTGISSMDYLFADNFQFYSFHKSVSKIWKKCVDIFGFP